MSEKNSKQCDKPCKWFALSTILVVIGGYLGYSSPVAEVLGKPLAAIVGISITLFATTVILLFYVRIKKIFFDNCKTK